MLHDCCSELLTLQALPAVSGVHPVHLSRTFDRFERCAVSERLRLIRVQHATREIACRQAPLADAAAAAGFIDHSHMTRIFRRTLGMTPGRFRSAVRTPVHFRTSTPELGHWTQRKRQGM